ncbi:MAG TPA: hypothetical protein PK098_09700 [Phycisphaerales bacterium]|nr:hypothetical protein [Phycisphaerales bacterium]
MAASSTTSTASNVAPLVTKRHLSSNRARLIEKMQRLNFGQIANIPIRNGDPALDPFPKVTREVKFGGDNKSRPESELGDFTLKKQVQEFIEELDRVGNGMIEVLIIKHGLPFLMHVAERASADAV